MIPKIQIAGLKSRIEVDLCLDAGADGFGLLLMLDYPRGDALTPETARELSDYIKAKNGLSVLISHARDLDSIAAAAQDIGPSAYQLHNDSEHELSAQELQTIKSRLGTIPLIKVLHIPSHGELTEPLRKRALMIAEIADAIIFDSKATEQIDGQTYETLGGTGQQNNWDIARDLVHLVAPCPVIHAGGLTPDNVADAIAHIRPYGVDVNSGVRKNDSVEKDPGRVLAFVDNAEAALRALGR